MKMQNPEAGKIIDPLEQILRRQIECRPTFLRF